MGKGIKVFVITACVCILMGILLIVGVLACGGKDVVSQTLRNGVYFSEDGFHVGGTVVFGDTYNMELQSGNDMEFDADEIKNLDLELTAGTFTIKEEDTDKIIVRSAKKIDVSQDGDTLEVSTEKRGKIFFVGGTDEGNRIEITLPKGRNFHKIDIEVGAGQMNSGYLYSDEMEMEIGAGSITMDGFQCKKAKVVVGAGEAIIKDGYVGNMDMEVGLGDIQFNGFLDGNLDADCGMGNMDIELLGLEENYDYKIDVGMGDVTIGNNKYGGMATSKEIDNNKNKVIDLDCGMGSIKIKF